jgi:hypothetical protein
LDVEFSLNVIDALLILAISLPTFYIATKVKQSKLRLLTLLLTGFLIFHGLYHATAALGTLPGLDTLGTLSDLFFEPLGWLIFLLFAVYLARYSA